MGTPDVRQAWVADPKSDAGPDQAKFKAVTGVACLNKPRDRGHRQIGLWTSTFLGPEHVSGWVQWCLGESFAGPEFRVWLLEVDPEARVLIVDSMDDLKALLATYGAEGEMRRLLGRDSMFPPSGPSTRTRRCTTAAGPACWPPRWPSDAAICPTPSTGPR